MNINCKGVFTGDNKEKLCRFMWLFISATVIPIILSIYWYFASDTENPSLLKFNEFLTDKYRTPLIVLILSLPPAIVLWIYRTIDVTENLYFNIFSHAADLLKDIENIHAIQTGVALLIKLSKQTKIFNRLIGEVFASLLNARIPLDKRIILRHEDSSKFEIRYTYLRSYTMEILKWFDKEKSISMKGASLFSLSDQRFDLADKVSIDAFKKMILRLSKNEGRYTFPTLVTDSLDDVIRKGEQGDIFVVVFLNGPSIVMYHNSFGVWGYDKEYSGEGASEALKELGLSIKGSPSTGTSADKDS